ncbi:MAG: hypothetical protein HY748_04485 [Elusimicrobia bacterium]|nr:hypothetical protein [Elusimicrobiota bacterium]
MRIRATLSLLKDLLGMVRAHKAYFLLPLLFALVLGILLVIVLESPALIPFFYAIF